MNIGKKELLLVLLTEHAKFTFKDTDRCVNMGNFAIQ